MAFGTQFLLAYAGPATMTRRIIMMPTIPAGVNSVCRIVVVLDIAELRSSLPDKFSKCK